jgi:hypothetical protein
MRFAADFQRHSGRPTASRHDAENRHIGITGRGSTYPAPIPVQTNPAGSQPEQPQGAGPATTPNGVPLEKQDATYITDYPSAAVLAGIDKVVRVVRADGYRCDSVSSYQPYLTSRGFELECNHFAYKYDFEDKAQV